jgi:long-chain fatty acid transport protein
MKAFSYYVLLIISASQLLAGPIEDTFGVGARNKALGGAGINIAEDYTATFYNPALLALCRGSRLSLGYDFIHTGLKNNNSEADQLGNYQAMNMGFCLKPLNHVGIGLYSNFSMGPIEFNAQTLTTTPTFVMYGGDLKAFSMMLGMGYAPIKQLSFGAAMSMATGVNLGSNLTYTPGGNPPLQAQFPAQISPIVGAIVGVTGIPLPDWKLSFVYRSSTYGQIDIKTKFDVTTNNIAETLVQGFISYSPHQFALGSSYLLTDKWLLTGDITYYLWSKYEGPFLRVQNSPSSTIQPTLVIAGTQPPNFSNIFVSRIGVEYTVWDKLKLRAGYAFRPTPAPPPTPGGAQLLDASAHRLSLGTGYEFQLYQNIFLIADAFFAADILHDGRGSAINTGLLIGAEYD